MADKLKSIIADVLRISSEEIADDLTMKQTSAWDSLKHMELIGRLESELNVAFSEEQMISMVSASKIYEIILQNKV